MSGGHASGPRHGRAERPRRPALAGGVARRLRRERRRDGRRPGPVAAMADGPGEKAGLRGAAASDEVECRCDGRDLTVAGTGCCASRPPRSRPGRRSPAPSAAAPAGASPNGGPKSMMAKAVMLRMHRDGTVAPPPPLPAPKALDEARPPEFRIVGGGTREGRLRNGSVARRHCPGCTRLVGAQDYDPFGHAVLLLHFRKHRMQDGCAGHTHDHGAGRNMMCTICSQAG